MELEIAQMKDVVKAKHVNFAVLMRKLKDTFMNYHIRIREAKIQNKILSTEKNSILKSRGLGPGRNSSIDLFKFPKTRLWNAKFLPRTAKVVKHSARTPRTPKSPRKLRIHHK